MGTRRSRTISPGHLAPTEQRTGLCERFPAQTTAPFYLGTPGWGHPRLDGHKCLIISLQQGDLLGTFYRWGNGGMGGLGRPGHKVRKQWSWLRIPVRPSQNSEGLPLSTMPPWAAAAPMQEAAWGQRETPGLLAGLAHCPLHQAANVSVHRITTPWCSRPSSRTDEAGWCCCPSRHTASPAKGTGRWR